MSSIHAQIHLEKSEAHVQPFFQGKAHIVTGMTALYVRIAVHANFIPEFAAQQLVQRHAIGFARQIPQGDLNAADAAALPGMPAELLNLAENLIYIAGIFAQNAALEHQSIGLAGCVPNLAISGEALIGFNFQNRTAFGRAVNIDETHIRDLQIRRAGAGIDRIRNHIRHGFLLFQQMFPCHYSGAFYDWKPDYRTKRLKNRNCHDMLSARWIA